MAHRGKRSDEAQARRKRKRLEKKLVHRVLLDYEFKDWLNGEIVYTPEHTDKCVKTKLQVLLGYVPQHAIQKDRYGEVLNRFTLKPISPFNYVFGF